MASLNSASFAFAALFKKYRLRSEFKTLSEFGDALAEEGLVYENSLFSHWQSGNRIPKNRSVILSIIKIFVKRGAITSIYSINEFLERIDNFILTPHEEMEMVELLRKNSNSNGSDDWWPTENFALTIAAIKESDDVLFNIGKQVDIAYQKIFEGYAHLANKNLKSLRGLINDLLLNKNIRGRNLIAKLNWVKGRTLADTTKPSNFGNAFREARNYLEMANENNVSELGQTYCMVGAIRRLELVTRPNGKFTKREIESCLNLILLGMTNLPKSEIINRILAHLEAGKLALLLNDQYYFYRQIDILFSLLNKVSSDHKFYESMTYDLLIRGSLKFKKDKLLAFENLQKMKETIDIKYRAVSLYLENTELQILTTVNDPVLNPYREKLRRRLKKEVKILNNPYQTLRLRNNKLIGL